MTEHVNCAPGSGTDRRAELIKLARVLDVAPEAVAHIPLDSSALRDVREAISSTLFDAPRPMLQRVAKASKLLPVATAARVGEHVFGPLLCARMVGLLAPEHAVELALRLPDDFLADTSAQLDPRQARAVVAALPKDRIVAVAGVLVARNDVVTVARFVDYLAADTIEAVIASIGDELVLLHIATFVDADAKLGELIALIPPSRLRAMIERVGAHGGELWLEAIALAARLDDRWQRTMAELASELEPALLDGMVAAVRAAGAWDLALPLVAAMSNDGRQRFLALASVDDEVLDGLIAAATRVADL